MDFIVDLPPSLDEHGISYTNIFVIVCRLTKRRKFVPMVKITARSLAIVFEREVWKDWGFLEIIVSDRGTNFTSKFWTYLYERVKTHPIFSTTFHPETDG